jgi:hypothetical protein
MKDSEMMQPVSTSNSAGYRIQRTADPLDDDWYDPTDAGRAHVDFIGGGKSLPSSFQTRKSLIEDHDDEYEEDFYEVIHKRRKNFYILGLLATLAIVGAITTSIILSHSKRKEHELHSADKRTTSNFHPITGSLVSACSLKSIKTVSGIKLCQSMCSVADCCEIPDGKEFSCYLERKKDCDDYRRVCSAIDLSPDKLDDESDLQKAEYVMNMCGNLKYLSKDGKQSCEDLCKPHECCFTQDEQKQCDFESNKCHIYSGCFTLYDSQNSSIFNTVHSKCHENVLTSIYAFNQCHSICASHLCCVSQDPNESCADKHAVECALYAPCAILTKSSMIIDKNTTVTTKPSTLSTVKSKCSEEALSTMEAFNECHSICESHLCCVSEDPNVNCAAEMAVGCAAYSPCTIVNKSPHFNANQTVANQPSIFKEVQLKCSEEVLTTTNSINECHFLCEAHLCCSSPNSTENCADENNKECSSYTPCGILHDSKFSDKKSAIENQPSILEMAQSKCSKESLNTFESINDCHSVCESHLCCSSPNSTENCAEKNSLECAPYSPCAILTNSSIFDEKNPAGTLPSILNTVQSKCSKDVLTSEVAYDECYTACELHLCCTTTDSDQNCFAENSLECASYSPCAILFESSYFKQKPHAEILLETIHRDKDKLAQACDIKNVEDMKGLGKCHDMCSKVMCCFVYTDYKSSCIDSLGDDICSLYGPCEILANGNDNPKKTVKAPKLGGIEELCKSDKIKLDGGKSCKDECDKGSCCFTSGAGGCQELEKDFCKPFISSCKDVYPSKPGGDKKESTKPGPVSSKLQKEISDICSLDNFSKSIGPDKGQGICHRICDPFECCFEDKISGKCNNSEEDCAQTHGCNDLFIYEEVNMRVDTACAEEMVIKECQVLCADHLCCFDKPITSSCHEASCGLYESCSILLQLP